LDLAAVSNRRKRVGDSRLDRYRQHRSLAGIRQQPVTASKYNCVGPIWSLQYAVDEVEDEGLTRMVGRGGVA
jgi:hypothetical protein